MKDFTALTAEEQIAKIKASERAERDRKDARWEAEQQAEDASTCRWCGRRWLTVMAARPKPPVFIREAKAFGHWICYQRFKESR